MDELNSRNVSMNQNNDNNSGAINSVAHSDYILPMESHRNMAGDIAITVLMDNNYYANNNL